MQRSIKKNIQKQMTLQIQFTLTPHRHRTFHCAFPNITKYKITEQALSQSDFLFLPQSPGIDLEPEQQRQHFETAP